MYILNAVMLLAVRVLTHLNITLYTFDFTLKE